MTAALLLMPATGTAAAPRPSPAQRRAAALAVRGVLRRSDLGRGWSPGVGAPRSVAPLTCGGPATASAASPSWSDPATQVFASGTAYAWASAAQARRAWGRAGSAAMGRCLERQFAAGSTSQTTLRATGVRRLAIPGAPARVASRRFQLTGSASGAGQQVDVTVDVLLIFSGDWIGEDELSVAASSPSLGLERRIVAAQSRRITG